MLMLPVTTMLFQVRILHVQESI